MGAKVKTGKTSSPSRSKRVGKVAVAWANEPPFPVPIPKDEPERLAALQSYDVLDTLPEEVFDNLTLLASHICQTPIAMVTLVDSDRQWFKSKVGTTVSETSRDIAFCAHAIMQEELFVVPDAAADKRFARNPLVLSRPKIRFYAGAPLITPNHRALGTLCVIDRIPRQLTHEQLDALRALSRAVMAQLETRREMKDMQRRLNVQGTEQMKLSREVAETNARRKAEEESARRLTHEIRTTNKAILDLLDQALREPLGPKLKRSLKSIQSLAQSLIDASEKRP